MSISASHKLLESKQKGRKQRQINLKILKNPLKKSLELKPPDLTLTYLTATTGSRKSGGEMSLGAHSCIDS